MEIKAFVQMGVERRKTVIDALHAWSTGRRNPTPEHVKGLAGALRRRGGELTELAEKLEEAAGE